MDFSLKQHSCYAAQVGYDALAANMKKAVDQSLVFFNQNEDKSSLEQGQT